MALIESARVPQTWAELADDIGPAAALALSAAYGGVNIYVPSKMTRGHAIARLFEATGAGYGAALALSELHGDTTLHVPQLSVFWRIRHAAQALELLQGGATHQQAAEALGISLRALYRALEFARALAIQARRRRDRRRLRRSVMDVARETGQLPLFDVEIIDGLLRQSAAGARHQGARHSKTDKKEMRDAAAGQDAADTPRARRAL